MEANSRRISALFPKAKGLLQKEYHIVPSPRLDLKKIVSFFFLFFLIFTIFLGKIAFDTFKQAERVKRERVEATAQLEYWESVLAKHPDYPDALYKAAVSAVRLGEKEKAKEFIHRAIELDPTFQAARELGKKLSG